MYRYVSSDCDAVAIMHDAQRYTPTPEDTVAVALKAGKCSFCSTGGVFLVMQVTVAEHTKKRKRTQNDCTCQNRSQTEPCLTGRMVLFHH